MNHLESYSLRLQYFPVISRVSPCPSKYAVNQKLPGITNVLREETNIDTEKLPTILVTICRGIFVVPLLVTETWPNLVGETN